MKLSPENKWYSLASSAKANYYTVQPNSKYTLSITDVPDNATFKWYEGGFRDENEVQSEMRWYELTYHTKSSLTLQTDNDKFHKCIVTIDGVETETDMIFIKVLTYEQICAHHQCKGKYGCWCKSCGAECYVESGPPDDTSEVERYYPGEDYSDHQGVEYDREYADSTEFETGRIDLKNTIVTAQNGLKQKIQASYDIPHLNPTVDNTDQVDELFKEYGLDIETPEGQQMFHELQIFEKQNYIEEANTEHLKNLLDPFQKILCCLENEVRTYRPIIWARAPHIFFEKFQLVNIRDLSNPDPISGYMENYFCKASSFQQTEAILYSVSGESDYQEWVNMTECQGVLLRKPRYRGELLPVLTNGVIKDQRPWYGTPGNRLWLGETGNRSSSIPSPDEMEYRDTCIYQEIGYETEDGFCFNPSQRIIRHIAWEQPS